MARPLSHYCKNPTPKEHAGAIISFTYIKNILLRYRPHTCYISLLVQYVGFLTLRGRWGPTVCFSFSFTFFFYSLPFLTHQTYIPDRSLDGCWVHAVCTGQRRVQLSTGWVYSLYVDVDNRSSVRLRHTDSV